MPESQPENIVDQLFSLLEQLLLPNWPDLILLLPWVLFALVIGWLLFTAWQWRRAASNNRSRVPRRLAGGAPPPGVHMPGPSRWPFVAPIGAALALFAFALPPRDATGAATGVASIPLLVAGLLVGGVAIVGWLLDAMREWRATERGGHGELVVAASDVAALPAGGLSAGWGVRPRGIAAGPAAAVAVAEPEFVAVEPPPGVHMPGPSPWPFFAPIAVTLMLFGLVFSAVLIIGGLVLAIIAAAGWLRDAGREYRTTEEFGHAVPATRDPAKVWPRRLVPIFAGVIAISLLIALAPVGLSFINGLTPPSAGPTTVPVPAVPEISASTAVSFDVSTLVVPAGRPFDLVFKNNQAGVPHNVQIDDSPARNSTLFNGELITGVAEITYHVDAIAEGDYYFLCEVHPNMNGTLEARPEAGGPAGPGGGDGADGAPSGPPPAP